jgi:predicted AlkP superfamily pyrophosphatase or phosphodiesterase
VLVPLVATVVVLLAGVCLGTTALTGASDPPKLLVIVVVDQMRADYVERFQDLWSGGLKRMVTSGAWLRRAAYPYLETVTCAGHATISTGAFPHRHGIFQNAWWDRELHKQMTCTEDPRVSSVSYLAGVTGGDSAYRLLVPTLADALRSARRAHVATLAVKDRSAVMLAGHGGDAVTWLGDSIDTWQTSSAYSKEPVPAVKSFLDANRISADFGKVWDRLLPASRYPTVDDGTGEAPPAGWTTTFPHALKGTTGKPDDSYFSQWLRSPYADAFMGRFAAALVESLKLGKHEGTDLLGVSFSSPDLVGHAFGPRSQEVQDMYNNLDRTLATLFDRLDVLVGRDQWVAALSADHGVTVIPEQLRAEGKDAGRMSPPAMSAAIDKQVEEALGRGPHVALIYGDDLYFHQATAEKLRRSPDLLKSIVKTIAAMPGVGRVLIGDEVRAGEHSSESRLRPETLSYVPGRSGDIIIIPKPGWIMAARGATHGSATSDDQQVPILFMGPGIKPGRYDEPATPADIAPTLAALTGITLPRAEGRALTFLISQ